MDILRVCDALLLHHYKFKDLILIAFQNKYNPLCLASHKIFLKLNANTLVQTFNT